MRDTGLVRSAPIGARLATGYTLGRRGAQVVPDRDWIGAAVGGMYSTTSDIARFAAALMRGGTSGHGPVLDPAALAGMFETHYRPDPRLPGWGLGFVRAEAGGHRLVGHDGILPGFNSKFLMAPDDGVGVVAFTNGSKGAFMWLETEFDELLRDLLGVPDEVVRTDIPHHPEIWAEVCGRYRLPPRISDLRGRLAVTRGCRGDRPRRAPGDPGVDPCPGAATVACRCTPTTRTTPSCSASTCRSWGCRACASCSAAMLPAARRPSMQKQTSGDCR